MESCKHYKIANRKIAKLQKTLDFRRQLGAHQGAAVCCEGVPPPLPPPPPGGRAVCNKQVKTTTIATNVLCSTVIHAGIGVICEELVEGAEDLLLRPRRRRGSVLNLHRRRNLAIVLDEIFWPRQLCVQLFFGAPGSLWRPGFEVHTTKSRFSVSGLRMTTTEHIALTASFPPWGSRRASPTTQRRSMHSKSSSQLRQESGTKVAMKNITSNTTQSDRSCSGCAQWQIFSPAQQPKSRRFSHSA